MPEDLTADLAAVAAAARAQPRMLWHDMRGLDRRGRRQGPDRSGSVRELCKVGPWADRLAQAWAWRAAAESAEGAVAQHQEGVGPPPAAAARPPPQPPPALAERWAGWLSALRREQAPEDVAIWIEPLVPRAVEDGVLHLVVPNAYFVNWLEEHGWTAILEALVGLDVALELPSSG